MKKVKLMKKIVIYVTILLLLLFNIFQLIHNIMLEQLLEGTIGYAATLQASIDFSKNRQRNKSLKINDTYDKIFRDYYNRKIKFLKNRKNNKNF